MKNILFIIFSTQIFIIFSACSHSKQLVRPESESQKVSLKARDLFLKGLFFQSEGRHNEALVQFYQALHHDSTSPTIYNSIAENHIKLGHYESALILLKNSLSRDENNIETLDLTADTYFRMRKDEEAIAAFSRILELDPYNEDARKYLIFLYEKRNDELGLAEQYNQLNELYGKDASKLEKMAEIYIKYKKYDKALNVYNEILEMDTTSHRTHYLIGNVNRAQKKIESAISSYQKALKFKSNYFPAIQELALIYRSKEEWQQVIDVVDNDDIDIDSTIALPKLLLAESHYYLKNYNEARSILLPILRKGKVPRQAYDLIARVEFESKNYIEAKKYFHKIINDDNKNRFAWLFLGFTYTDMGHPDSAAITYQKALSVFPKDATLLSFYGYSLQEQEKFGEAIPPLTKAIQLDPENINAISSLAVVYENLALFQKCDSLYNVGIERFPDNALLLNNYSYSLSERNIRLEEALSMAQKAINGNPDNAAYLDTIGWIHFKLGHLIEAEKYIKKAVELREDSPVVLEHLGDVYFKLGDTESAKEYWQRSIELEPDNALLRDKMEQI